MIHRSALLSVVADTDVLLIEGIWASLARCSQEGRQPASVLGCVSTCAQVPLVRSQDDVAQRFVTGMSQFRAASEEQRVSRNRSGDMKTLSDIREKMCTLKGCYRQIAPRSGRSLWGSNEKVQMKNSVFVQYEQQQKQQKNWTFWLLKMFPTRVEQSSAAPFVFWIPSKTPLPQNSFLLLPEYFIVCVPLSASALLLLPFGKQSASC